MQPLISFQPKEKKWRGDVQDSVHDVTHEIVRAVPAQQGIRVECRGAAEEKHACEDRRGGERAFAAYARCLNEQTAEETAGDTEDGDDE